MPSQRGGKPFFVAASSRPTALVETVGPPAPKCPHRGVVRNVGRNNCAVVRRQAAGKVQALRRWEQAQALLGRVSKHKSTHYSLILCGQDHTLATLSISFLSTSPIPRTDGTCTLFKNWFAIPSFVRWHAVTKVSRTTRHSASYAGKMRAKAPCRVSRDARHAFVEAAPETLESSLRPNLRAVHILLGQHPLFVDFAAGCSHVAFVDHTTCWPKQNPHDHP